MSMASDIASKVYEFQSAATERGAMPHFDQEWVKNEPMFFGCDLNFAYALGGPITRAFIDELPKDWIRPDVILDGRVHMLMPGWFPCIPGWHLDDVPRSRPDGQPDHDDPEYKAEHLLCCIGDASLTLFGLGNVRIEEPEPGKVIYGEWHPRVEAMVEAGEIEAWTVPECTLVEFDWRSFHRGQAAHKNGWRWFCRITRNSKRPVMNEIRRQVQVYMSHPNEGW